jgi:hypothetical protein
MSNDWNPNHGGKTQYKKKNHFSFGKDNNTLVFRILPQPKGLAYGSPEYNSTPFSKDWHKFHSSVFGFKNKEGKFRVFESPLVKDNKTKTVKSPCAATDLILNLKAKLEEARTTGNAAVQPKLNALVGLKGVYSLDNNQHMNVVLLDGSIGELKLRYKAFLQLKAEIDKLLAGTPDEPGFDPLSFNNGRFFVMTRSTAGRDTTFNVSVYKEKVEVAGHGKLEKPLVHVITPEFLARLETEGFNLDDIYLKVTSEECAQIVAEVDLMSGKSPAIDRFFDDKWKAKRETYKAQAGAGGAAPASQAPVAQTPTTQVAAAQATPAPVTVPVAAPMVKTQDKSVGEQSDDEFFKSLGVELGVQTA